MNNIKHYIQYSPEEDLFVLYRLWENKRIRLTALSNDDLNRIMKKYKFYQNKKDIKEKILKKMIADEKKFIDIITSNVGEAPIAKTLIKEAWERIDYYIKNLEKKEN